MSLRLKFILYLIFIHLLFARVAISLLSKHLIWLLAVEAVFIIPLVLGVRLSAISKSTEFAIYFNTAK